jgi:hypothetical protein
MRGSGLSIEALIVVAAFSLSACAQAGDRPDNGQAIADIRDGSGGQEVVVQGTVTDAGVEQAGVAGTHEQFHIRVIDGAAAREIEVADNITIGEQAPIVKGETVIVKGVLEVDPSGPVIHWTHHDPEFRHVAGFVEVAGKKYD